MGLNKLKSVCKTKKPLTQQKRQPIEREKTFTNDVADKGLTFKAYKQLIQLNIKTRNNPIKNWTEDLNRLWNKGALQMANRHMKRCATLLTEKCKSKPQWVFTSHLSEWLSSKNLQITNVCECAEKRKLLYRVGGNASWLTHYKKQYATAAKSLQSCPTLCDPIDGSPPGSPIPGILQARTLEWVAFSFSNAGKWKVKGKSLSHVRLFATSWTAVHQAPLSMGFSRQEYWSGMSSPSPIKNNMEIFKKQKQNYHMI